MILTKNQIGFLKAARQADPRDERLHAIWCMKKQRAVVALDGFTMHALPVGEPSETYAFNLIKGMHSQTELSLSPLPARKAPNIDALEDGKEVASMWINPKLLLKTLEAMCRTHRGGSIKLAIRKSGGGEALALSGEMDNLGGFYAMIMGMHRDDKTRRTWDPWSENDDFHPPK